MWSLGWRERRRLWSLCHQVICLQQGTLFQNSWWESGQESSYSFPIPKSPGPLGKVYKILLFPSTCYEICVTPPQPSLPQCFAPSVSHKTESILTLWWWRGTWNTSGPSTVQITRMEGRAEGLCFSCGHPVFSWSSHCSNKGIKSFNHYISKHTS